MKAPDIITFVTDPQLLGLSISPAQETLLRALYGLPLLNDEQFGLWQRCTGREVYPSHGFSECTAICGARSGKDSRLLAPVLLFEALFGDHLQHLGKGEKAMIPCVAQDSRGARVLFGYIKDYVMGSPLLASAVEEVLTSEITLTNRTVLSIFPCTLKSLRGWSIPAGGLDEAAYFRLEGSAESDVEIQQSIRRGMVGFPSPKLLKASTAYMRTGLVYDDYKRAFGSRIRIYFVGLRRHG